MAALEPRQLDQPYNLTAPGLAPVYIASGSGFDDAHAHDTQTSADWMAWSNWQPAFTEHLIGTALGSNLDNTDMFAVNNQRSGSGRVVMITWWRPHGVTAIAPGMYSACLDD